MKMFAVVITMGALVGSVCAQEERKRPGGGGRGTTVAPKGAEALLSALDRNGDGKLQQEEIDLAVVVLRRMDRDSDGIVSSDEMVAPPRGGRPSEGGGQRRFQGFDSLDKDGDGKISKEEAPGRMKERFDQMDSNSDGVLDKAEQEAVVKRLRERMGQGNQGGGRRRQEDPSGGVKPKRPEQK